MRFPRILKIAKTNLGLRLSDIKGLRPCRRPLGNREIPPKGGNGPPWGPSGPPWALWAPLEPRIRCDGCSINSKNLPQIHMFSFVGPKWVNKKLGFRPWDPHGEIRAGILRRIPVSRSQMVGWRPIWWQKGVTWGPLGFRARPAHPAGGEKMVRVPLVKHRQYLCIKLNCNPKLQLGRLGRQICVYLHGVICMFF